MRRISQSLLVGCVLLILAAPASGDDVYYHVPVTQLQLTKGKLPAPGGRGWNAVHNLLAWPRVLLDNPGEAYVAPGWPLNMANVAVRAPAGKAITGRLAFENGATGKVETV